MLALQYGRVPFVPKAVLKKFKALEPSDNRFRSAARLRQALLREQRGWPMGDYIAPNGARRKLGNYVAPKVEAAAAFISADIAQLVRREVAYREDNAMIDETRLWRNLLSSAPLVFNLFGPLKLDLKLATRVMRRLCPTLVHTVTEVLFEHSPGRRDPRFTLDRTAFDVLLNCRSKDGRPTFVAVEVKFSESLDEPAARLRERYDELTRASCFYRDPDAEALRKSPLQQFWRQHLLAFSIIENGLCAAGAFIVIAPSLNRPAQQAIATYADELLDPHSPVQFEGIPLETIVRELERAGATETAAALFERYIDLSPLDALI